MKPTFICFLLPTESARVLVLCSTLSHRTMRSNELTLDPIELALHVVDDVAALHRRGQHVPRVGLDLEMRRELVLLVELQRVLDREARRLEVLADLVEEH